METFELSFTMAETTGTIMLNAISAAEALEKAIETLPDAKFSNDIKLIIWTNV